MRYEKLETTATVIGRLFDPRSRSGSSPIPLAVKYAYLQHSLSQNWQEIVGANLARRCSVYRLSRNELCVRTANSLLANELYMMQALFLKKVNTFFGGRLLIRKLSFHTGSFLKKQEAAAETAIEEAPVAISYTKCPRCGARMDSRLKLCSCCDREQREQQRAKIAELLQIQPWLRYDDCRLYYKCDKMLFTTVREGMLNYYCERVRLGHATAKERLLAVLLLTSKKPEELTEAEYESALAYLRRNSWDPQLSGKARAAERQKEKS